MGTQSTLDRKAGLARRQMSTALAVTDARKSSGTKGQSVLVLRGLSDQPDSGAST